MQTKKNIMITIGMILVFVGSLLPAIRIAQENISFIKESGSLIIILVLTMFLLIKLNYRQLLYIPSTLSIIIIVKFIIDNKERINNINQLYNSYASYQYGIVVMLLGNLLILIPITLSLFNIKIAKEKPKKINEKKNNKINLIKETLNKQKEKIKNKSKNKQIQLINKNITHETTKDGKIRFSKITVKCENTKKYKEKKTIKKIISKLIEKIIIRRFVRKKLSISKFKELKEPVNQVPTIDIKKWTRSDICCSNCGATIHTTSEYCFLCDCKIKIYQEEKKA